MSMIFSHDYDANCPCDECQGIEWPAPPVLTKPQAGATLALTSRMAERAIRYWDDLVLKLIQESGNGSNES